LHAIIAHETTALARPQKTRIFLQHCYSQPGACLLLAVQRQGPAEICSILVCLHRSRTGVAGPN